VKLARFCEKYDVDKALLYVLIHQGSAPRTILKKYGKETIVDEEWFTSRIDFKHKIRNLAHSYYYFLSKHLSDLSIGRALNKIDSSVNPECWSVFMSTTLFSLQSDSITDVRIRKKTWKFYKLCRMIIRELLKIKGQQLECYDLEKIWR
jgi:hypothetical protein